MINYIKDVQINISINSNETLRDLTTLSDLLNHAQLKKITIFFLNDFNFMQNSGAKCLIPLIKLSYLIYTDAPSMQKIVASTDHDR